MREEYVPNCEGCGEPFAQGETYMVTPRKEGNFYLCLPCYDTQGVSVEGEQEKELITCPICLARWPEEDGPHCPNASCDKWTNWAAILRALHRHSNLQGPF